MSKKESNWGPQTIPLEGDSKTLAGQTAHRLRLDIISNRLQPGERLTFSKLAKLYDVGSSPLREALFQVMSEGLVRSQEHKGFMVAPIDADEMLDISSLRAHLEVLALRLSIEKGDLEWEAQIVTSNHLLKKARMQLNSCSAAERTEAENEWEMRHRELHTALCNACGSPWLMYFIKMLYEHLERYRRYFWDYSKRATHADDEHEQIVQAALERDADKAEKLLHQHFQTQAELSLQAGKKEESA